MSRFQIVSDNGRFFRHASVWLSTVELFDTAELAALSPELVDKLSIDDFPAYESCLFGNDGKRADVIMKYHTLAEALEGHAKLEYQYRLRRIK